LLQKRTFNNFNTVLLKQRIHIIILFFAIAITTVACTKPVTDWSIGLMPSGDRPFDLGLFKSHLPELFPSAKLKVLRDPFKSNYQGIEGAYDDTAQLHLYISQDATFGVQNIRDMANWVAEGNYFVLAANEFESTLWQAFNMECKTVPDILGSVQNGEIRTVPFDSWRKNFKFQWQGKLQSSASPDSFSYTGASIASAFQFLRHEERSFYHVDFAKPIAFMHDENNAVAGFYIQHGYGKIIVLNSPLYFTNHFLLQGNNVQLMERLLSVIPASIVNVYISNFHEVESDDASGSGGSSKNTLASLMKYPMWNRALWLTLLGLVLYALLLARRKQRPLEVVPKIENASLEFVETIGQLYFSKRSNQTIAEKMIMQIKELHVANTDAIAAKCAKPTQQVMQLLTLITQVQKTGNLPDPVLTKLYTQIQAFKKTNDTLWNKTTVKTIKNFSLRSE
jgi:hypothetical protein